MKKENIFWGCTMIVASISLICSKLGYLEGLNLFSIVAAIFLGGIMIKSITKAQFGGILFPLAFICILFDDELGITAITPWTVLFAALLGTIGLSLIFHKKSIIHHHHGQGDFKALNIENGEYDDEDHLKIDHSFSQTIKYVKSQNFVQGFVRCSFGNSEIYFDNASLADGKGEVIFDLSFSGAELYVPKEWTVINNVNCSFGGVSEKNLGMKGNENKLVLSGSLSFSGITIIYI